MTAQPDARQFDLFAHFAPARRPAVARRIVPHGQVVQGDVDEVIRLPHPRMAWDRARIELHRHDDGLWMWSTQYHTDLGGGGYRVGAKWGNFAHSRDDALFYACRELRERLAVKRADRAVAPILAWLDELAA